MANINVLPASLDITMYQGDTLVLPMVFRDGFGAALDLTSYTFEAQILDVPADDTASVPVDMTCVVTDGLAGKVEVTLTSLKSTPLNGPYVYDLQGDDGSGKVRTYLAGKLVVNPEVTR